MNDMIELHEVHSAERKLKEWNNHSAKARQMLQNLLRNIALSIDKIDKNIRLYEPINNLGEMKNAVAFNQDCLLTMTAIFECYITMIEATPAGFLKKQLNLDSLFFEFHDKLVEIENTYYHKATSEESSWMVIGNHFKFFSESACRVQYQYHSMYIQRMYAAQVYKLQVEQADAMHDYRRLVVGNTAVQVTFQSDPPLFCMWQHVYAQLTKNIKELKTLDLTAVFVNNKSAYKIIAESEKELNDSNKIAIVAALDYISAQYEESLKQLKSLSGKVRLNSEINADQLNALYKEVINQFNAKIDKMGITPLSQLAEKKSFNENLLNKYVDASIKAFRKTYEKQSHHVSKDQLDSLSVFLKKMNDNLEFIPRDLLYHEIVNALGSLSAQLIHQILNKATLLDPAGKRADKRLLSWMAETDTDRSDEWRRLDKDMIRFFEEVDTRVFAVLDKMDERAIKLESHPPDDEQRMTSCLNELAGMLASINDMKKTVIELQRSVSTETNSLDIVYSATIYNQYLDHIEKLESTVIVINEKMLSINVFQLSDAVADKKLEDLEAQTIESLMKVISQDLSENVLIQTLSTFQTELLTIFKKSSSHIRIAEYKVIFNEPSDLIRKWIVERNKYLSVAAKRAQANKVYKALSMVFHPDKHKGKHTNKVATAIFSRLSVLHFENEDPDQQSFSFADNSSFYDLIAQCKREITCVKTRYVRKVHLALLEIRLIHENDPSLKSLKEKCEQWEKVYCKAEPGALMLFDRFAPDINRINTFTLYGDYLVHGDRIIKKVRSHAEKILVTMLEKSEWSSVPEHPETIQGFAKKVVTGSIDLNKYISPERAQLLDFSIEISELIKNLVEFYEASKKQLTESLTEIKAARDAKEQTISNARKYYEAEAMRWQHAHVYCEMLKKLEIALQIQYVPRQYAMPLDNTGKRTVGINNLTEFHDDCYLRFCRIISKVPRNYHVRYCNVQQALIILSPGESSLFHAVSYALGYLSNQHNYTANEVRQELLQDLKKNGCTYHKTGSTVEETDINLILYFQGLESGSVPMHESYIFGVAKAFNISIAVTYFGDVELVDGQEVLKTRYYGSPGNRPIYLGMDDYGNYHPFIPMGSFLKKVYADIDASSIVSAPFLRGYKQINDSPPQHASHLQLK